MRGTIAGVVLFCGGIMTGLMMTSLTSNYKSVSQHMVSRSIMTSADGRELIALVKRYNETLSQQAHRILSAPTSHDEVRRHDEAINQKETIHFKDEHLHNDDEHVAKKLFDKVRVLCWVMTTKSNHQKKAIHVKATWGKRCNKLLFISDADEAALNAVKLDLPVGRDHLTAKTMQAFDLIYKDVDNFDWFMKADDDSYVILENLRYFLSSQNPDAPIFFGHHFKTIVAQGYFSGGGGYAISREALRRYHNRKPNDCSKDGGAEDVEFGRCMEKLGVKTGDSRDNLGRSRFHCFSPVAHITGYYPPWYFKYDKYGAKKGTESISDYAISFHYVDVEWLYNLEFFIYHLRPYGINSGDQRLNTAVQTGAEPNNATKPAT